MDHFVERRQFDGQLEVFSGEEFQEEQQSHGEFERQAQPDRQLDSEQESGVVDAGSGEDKHSTSNHDSSRGKLFVGGVSWETTEEAFSHYFSQYGDVADAVLMRDKLSGRLRGFGFITFLDPAVADKVLEEDHVINGRAVEIKRTVPRGDMNINTVSRTKKIFVGGIPSFLTEDELKEYFSVFGLVVEHQIMFDRTTRRSRGFGFVTFDSEDEVDKLFSEGMLHELGGKQVEIKRAEPKRASGDGFRGGAAAEHTGNWINGGGYGAYGYSGGYGCYGGSYGVNYAHLYGGYSDGFGGYEHGGYGFGYGVPPIYGNARYAVNGYGNSSSMTRYHPYWNNL